MTRCRSSRVAGSCPASASSRSRPSSMESTSSRSATSSERPAPPSRSRFRRSCARSARARRLPRRSHRRRSPPMRRLADVVAASIADALTRIVRHDPQARLGEPEGVHQLRVAMRRLRSDLRTLGDAVDPRWREEIEPRLRAVADAAADARDADVMLTPHAARARWHDRAAGTAVRDPRATAHRRPRALDGDARRAMRTSRS